MACLGGGQGGNGVLPLILAHENRHVSVFWQKIHTLTAA